MSGSLGTLVRLGHSGQYALTDTREESKVYYAMSETEACYRETWNRVQNKPRVH